MTTKPTATGPANRYVATFTRADAVGGTVRLDNPVGDPRISVTVLGPEIVQDSVDVWRSADVIEIKFYENSKIAEGDYTVVILG